MNLTADDMNAERAEALAVILEKMPPPALHPPTLMYTFRFGFCDFKPVNLG